MNAISFFRIGAWCWIVTGVGHLAGETLTSLAPDAEAQRMNDLMRGYDPLTILGVSPSQYQLTLGMSLIMSLALVTTGVLLLLIARLTADAPGRARTAGYVGLVGSATALVLSAVFLLIPPTITFTVASIAFGVALAADRRGRPTPQVHGSPCQGGS
ncbi:hypothetical protein ACIQ7Q_34690 [Streptomyces sp. NPDC096176]|uniref:LIC_13387 family protein n=1 Tax=Streptomyces sp. NPDC096176 TaxID=3366079 RepID=UPI003804814F